MSQQSEIIAVSEYTDGNYNVEQMLIMESAPSSNLFKVHYKMNLSNFVSTYENNSEEIAALHKFVESITQDSLKRITRFDIVGYSSPDGPTIFNDRLAKARANDFAKYVDKEFSMDELSRSVTGAALTWNDAKQIIESSATPNKEQIVAIISSGGSQAAIQSQIEKHTTAWNYIKQNVLPSMRCVDIEIEYNTWKLVENRTQIELVESPSATQSAQPTSDVMLVNMSGNRRVYDRDGNFVRLYNSNEPIAEGQYVGYGTIDDDHIYCLLVEMPGQPFDYDECDNTKSMARKQRGKRGKRSRSKMKDKENRRRDKFKVIES